MNNIQHTLDKLASDLEKKSGTTRYIVLHKDGNAARCKKAWGYEQFLFEIPIPQFYNNLKSRLLFCYDNGRVNVMIPKQLFDDKIWNEGIRKNGYNKKEGVTLMNVFVCSEDDFLVIYSSDAKGEPYIRADELQLRNSHKTMHTPGNLFIRDMRPYRWVVVPKRMRWLVEPILKKGIHSGIPLKDYKYAEYIEYIHKMTDEMNPRAIIRLKPFDFSGC